MRFISTIIALLIYEAIWLATAFLIGVIFSVSIPYVKVAILAAVLFVLFNVLRIAIELFLGKIGYGE